VAVGSIITSEYILLNLFILLDSLWRLYWLVKKLIVTRDTAPIKSLENIVLLILRLNISLEAKLEI
jgi:hypothetical protein